MKFKLTIAHIFTAFERVSRYLTKSRTEPQIVQKSDRHGNSYWQVYDPVSASRCSFGSEQEVKAWLDHRYYLR